MKKMILALVLLTTSVAWAQTNETILDDARGTIDDMPDVIEIVWGDTVKEYKISDIIKVGNFERDGSMIYLSFAKDQNSFHMCPKGIGRLSKDFAVTLKATNEKSVTVRTTANKTGKKKHFLVSVFADCGGVKDDTITELHIQAEASHFQVLEN
jgi:hypothetical protein